MHSNSFDITRRQALAGLGATSTLALSGCATVQASGPTLTGDALLEDIAYNLLAHEPERATGLGVDTGVHAALRGRLEDQSQAGQDAYAATLRADLARVRATDTGSLDADTRTSFEVVESAYATALDGFELPYGDVAVGSWRNAPYVVIQNVGTYLDLPRFMDSTQPMTDAADVDFYLERLGGTAAAFDGELERMRAARGMGVVPPDFLLAKAIAAMEASIAAAPKDYTAPLAKAPAGRAEQAQAQAGQIVAQQIVPALQRQLAELRTEAAQAKSDAGIWAQPRGDEWYAWGLRASTTTTLAAEEIHRIGLEQLEVLHGRMDPILREIGYTKGSVGERMRTLAEDPRYKFAEGDPGREQIMAFLGERVEWIKAQMPRAFDTLVNPNMEIRRIPPAEEIGAPGAYGGSGSKDGTIPGRMWINLRTTEMHRKYTLPTLVHHETIPGHVWEGEFSNRLPLIRSILAFNAFSEGWALYSEQLADELGAYDENPVWRLGYLQDAAFRAARLVVDTGLHAKRWSREKANQVMAEQTGDDPDEMASEVDRYCSWPGQACGYMIGKLEILRQRERARAALGGGYDLKAFDDTVVLGGNAPLDVMANNVSRYIEKAAG